MAKKKKQIELVAQYQEPVISNVIATCILTSANPQPLNLVYLGEKIEGGRLNSKKFPGLIVRKTNPKGTIIIFKSYKLVIIGCSSTQDCEVLSRKIVKDLKKCLNKKLEVKTFKICNMIANASLGYRVNVCSLAEEIYAYKDDKYPGVMLRLKQIKSVIVFSSGKLIMNGATKLQQLILAFQVLKKKLEEFSIRRNIQEDKIANQQKETNQQRETNQMIND